MELVILSFFLALFSALGIFWIDRHVIDFVATGFRGIFFVTFPVAFSLIGFIYVLSFYFRTMIFLDSGTGRVVHNNFYAHPMEEENGRNEESK